ncbi:MAG: protein kinase family protein [archaeon]|nr:protein kinase family protein [archaeon]
MSNKNPCITNEMIKAICEKYHCVPELKKGPLGEGSFSLVYPVKINNSQEAAIKCTLIPNIKDKEGKIKRKTERLKNEIFYSLSLFHQNIIRSFSKIEYHLPKDKGIIFGILMERANLLSLKNFYSNFNVYHNYFLSYDYKHKPPMPPENYEYLAIYLINNILNGVENIHRHSLVHFDLKPENILLTNYFIPKIIDFNITMYINPVYDPNKREEDILCPGGTLGYVGYEFYSKKKFNPHLAFRCDIFSLTCIIYYLFFNQRLITEDFLTPYNDPKDGKLKYKIEENISYNLQSKIENKRNYLGDEMTDLLKNSVSVDLSQRPSVYNFLEADRLNINNDSINFIYNCNDGYKEKFLIEIQKRKMILTINNKNKSFINKGNKRNKFILRRHFAG